jgi:DNA-binding response OmpR family regulator
MPDTNGLTVDLDARVVARGSKAARLTKNEMALFSMLHRRAGRLLAREPALQVLFAGAERQDEDNGANNYIRLLRRKLGPLGMKIHLVHGSGWVLEIVAEQGKS